MDTVKDDDANSDARAGYRLDACRDVLGGDSPEGGACGIRRRGVGRSGTDDVPEDGAGLDRRELAGVTDEDEAGVGADGFDEAGHQGERDH